MNDSLDAIKRQMRSSKGVHITIRTRYGRRGGVELGGIIEGLYPDVFTVLVKEYGYKIFGSAHPSRGDRPMSRTSPVSAS